MSPSCRHDVSELLPGRGRFLDNILIERLWRSLKYECVYLHAWETGSEARAGLRTWFDFYDHRRPQAALDGQPPDAAYRAGTTIMQPDQQALRVAQDPPDPVQGSGGPSAATGRHCRADLEAGESGAALNATPLQN
jgi:putative transposase